MFYPQVYIFPLVLLIAFAFSFYEDVDGYARLFSTSTETIEKRQCIAKLVDQLQFLNGSFILPSISQYEMGDQFFQGTFDAYGKIQRFDFSSGEFCLQSRMLQSAFYNISMETNSIAPQILFIDSVPTNSYNTMQKISGPNDNNMVNSCELGGQVRMLSDSPLFLDIDPFTLQVTSTFKYDDEMMKSGIPQGSAHPVKRKDGCLVNECPGHR